MLYLLIVLIIITAWLLFEVDTLENRVAMLEVNPPIHVDQIDDHIIERYLTHQRNVRGGQ